MNPSEFGQYDLIRVGKVSSSVLSGNKTGEAPCVIRVKLPVRLRQEVTTSKEDRAPYEDRASQTSVLCHISDAILVSATGQKWVWKKEIGADTIKIIFRGQDRYFKLKFASDFATSIEDGSVLSVAFIPKDYKAALQTVSFKLRNNRWEATGENAASLLSATKENKQRRIKHD